MRAVGRARTSARRPETIAASVIVLAGLILRAAFVMQWRPALIGYPDSGIYIEDAITGIFNNPLREGGYSELLRLLHAIRPHLAFVIEVQHMLGIASGLFLFGAIRRAGISERVALVPLAVVVLGGSELFVEHAPLTEAMFIFLIDAALYCVARTWTGRSWRWAILAGLALGVAVDTRSVALMLLPVLVVLGALFVPRPWHRRVICAAAMTLAAAVPIGWYLYEHQQTQGYGGLTGARYFDFYARVAPFADCTKFTPPAGTRRLCITMPPDQRPGHDFWEFSGISPAVAVYGEPDTTVPKPNENSQLRAFAIAAILGQPDRYLEFVARDLVRIVDPSFPSTPYHGGITAQGYGSSPEGLLDYYFNPTFSTNVQTQVSAYYPTDGTVHRGIGFLVTWERDTRIEGPLMALLLLLALAAPVIARGRERHAALLFGATTLVLLVGPILASGYDYRFVIPAFGSLAATAAIGAGVVARRLQRTNLASQIRGRAHRGAA